MFAWLYVRASFHRMLHRVQRFSAVEFDEEEGSRLRVLPVCEEDSVINEAYVSDIYCIEPRVGRDDTKCAVCFPATSE